ncbi:reverse transcriptase-like protein [Candidatus Saccharibacteria bacterium]|nr:reverse transcriptase-like protein [Candidatus Saccharibacteria bacterium]
MKQRIRVVGVIRNTEGVLVFKRNQGRNTATVFWELPTGKIKFGEQPEEAIARAITEYTGLTATTITLKDVVTFLALEGASRLSNLYIVYEIDISAGIKPAPRDRYTAYKYLKDLANSNIRLSEATTSVLEIIDGKLPISRINPRDTANSVAIHVDGASRGNPGPSGVGYVIHDSNGKIIEKGGEFIGFATSRVAEYYAMKKGVEQAISLGYKTARFFSDSLMVVNQLNGIFKVKNPDVTPIYHSIQALLKEMDSVSFTHIARSQNGLADQEANTAIDQIIHPVI